MEEVKTLLIILFQSIYLNFPSNFKELVKFNILINTLRIGLTDTKIHSKINKKI